MGSGDEEAEPP